MRTRDVGALLALACAALALSTAARAAPTFPLHLPADLGQGDRLLVQYGGGGDDDDDDRPARPAYRPPSNNGGGGGGGGAGAAIEILRGIGSAIQQQQQRDNQQRIIQQQQRANEEAQRHRDAARRDAAERAKRDAAERAKRDAADRARRDEIKKREAREEAIRQEKLKEQQDLAKHNELKKKREDAAKVEDEHYEKPPGYTPANQPGYGPPSAPYSEPDEIDDVPIKVYVEPPEDDYPDVPSLPDLVVGPTRLPACGYVNLPGDRTLCVGQTRKGGWLRIVNVPLKSGGAKAVCAQFCTVRPKVPEKKPQERFVYPTPQPNYPVQPVAPPPRPTYPAAPTDIATKVLEPKRQPVPAAPTDIATKVSEPKRQPVPAAPTDIATKVSEPKRQPVPAAPTDIATKVSEPKRQPVPAAPTDIATKVNEPKRHALPPVLTDIATKMTEPNRRGVPPALTDTASPVKQPEWKTAALTDKASTVPAYPSSRPDGARPQPKSDVPSSTLDAIDADDPPESKQAKRNEGQLDEFGGEPSFPPTRQPSWFPGMQHDQQGNCDAFLPGPRKDHCLDEHRVWNRVVDNGPLDGKGCTSAGAKPLTDAIAEPLAKFNPAPFSPREVVTTALSGIPSGIGGALSAVTKAFWKDDSSAKLFDAMKNYVDQVVPAAIAKYDTTQLNNDLAAIRNILTWYDRNRTASTKGQHLSELVTQLETMKPRFLNPQSPKSTLAEFVAFGTLHLSALKELYDHYDQYYPFDAKDANAAADHASDRSLVKSKLSDAIKEYQDHTQVLRGDIIADRLSKLRVNDRDDLHTVFYSAVSEPALLTEDYFSAKDDFCDWQGPEHKEDRGSAQADVERRKAAVTVTYEKLIDELTAPIAQWKPM